MSKNHTKNAAKYHKKSGKQYHLWLHAKNDADIIERLDSVGDKQGFIKALIRDDIKRGHNE